MIEEIKDVQSLDKIWRETLIKQSNVAAKNVINGLSVRGAKLADYITNNISMSYSLKNIAIIFEITLNNNIEDNVSMEEDDGSLTEYTGFTIKLTIYGSAAIEVSKLLKARLESEKCRNNLYDNGIYYDKISSLFESNDFINETMWIKVNMSIDFNSRLLFTQKDSYKDFEQTNGLYLLKV